MQEAEQISLRLHHKPFRELDDLQQYHAINNDKWEMAQASFTTSFIRLKNI
jgi:hypothetical protein